MLGRIVRRRQARPRIAGAADTVTASRGICYLNCS
jgi:hypothetical protein